MKPDLITPRQFKAARALLGYSREGFCHKARFPITTLRLFEAGNPVSTAKVATAVKAFENDGIRFVRDGVILANPA
ncbi:hypothetical protein [Sphingomonas beigongshangi]|uniref:hypothetical protein n=1 Tax=Sphingomonas beigongshangi TaxID=2782540 RepID=UPI00193B4EF4|nr:hypothetical protein [Sphingomonas beigongshangi]